MARTIIFFFALCLLGISAVNAQSKVTVLAFEMSKCPYCSAWKQNFNDAVMSQTGLPDIIDLVENFAGITDNGNGNFSCFHGPTECVGNRILLCANNLTASTNQWGWWNLGVCMQTTFSSIPDNAPACAAKVGLDWDSINSCASGSMGAELLSASNAVSNKYGVTETPTIFINGKEYVGGPPNPLKLICNAYQGTKPSGCPSA